uniref:B30.2/SPRY domain-containing protein n=1 Tax=Alexandrium catenella TaxID=2925 RepID=A0A7S1WG85_ALECA|mmetsp:Transcript_58225/g.155867  ORF Transcript_58225/g.155867 Transcript_58225/m.155867 type:complete len:830 (+) Transcript_58225:53-2542(+)
MGAETVAGDEAMVEVELEDEAFEGEEAEAAASKVGNGAAVAEPAAEKEVEAEEEMDDPYGAAPEDAPAAEEAAPARLEERELDEPEDKSARIARGVELCAVDATPDVLVSASGAVSSLAQGGFQHLRSGVRADTGAKAGRYLFEVKVIECGSRAESELRVGFSTAGSSLFLGDGSAENVCFSSEGAYYLADPGQGKAIEKAGACNRMTSHQVVGVLLNLSPESPNAMTVSVFLDGERAGKPQPIPAHLKGKALYPTLTFRNVTLAANFGARGLQLKALPFQCRMFSGMAKAHAESSGARASTEGKLEVVIPIGLPDRGVFDYAERFVQEHPGHVELSDRKFADWCRKSGLVTKGSPSPMHSRDRFDFNYGIPQLDGKAWRGNLQTLLQLSGRSCVLPEVRAGLLAPERKELLSKIPRSVRKVAVVVLGDPSKSFKDWVHEKIRSEYEVKKAAFEKRRDIAEAIGEELSEDELRPPEEPALGEDVCFLPVETGLSDLSEKALTGSYSHFTVPGDDEGFDEVRFEWSGRDEAEQYLQRWVTEKKATLIVDGLKPGTWFHARLKEWHKVRQDLRTSFSKYKSSGSDADVSAIKLEDVDVHNCDGDGTPIYANFKYEDWLLLSWRYELHLLVHAFMEDVADPDYKGIPEEHVAHYFRLYYGIPCDLKGKLGMDGLPAVVKLLKGPVELVELKPGYKVLQSTLPMSATADDFVRSIESYRRDRARRVEAGDESARLSFPKPSAKAAPAKAPVGKAPLAKAPVAKAPVGKAPVAKAKAPLGLAKAVTPSGPAGIKRPLVAAAESALKRPRPDAGASTPAVAKAPVTKAPVAKRKA